MRKAASVVLLTLLLTSMLTLTSNIKPVNTLTRAFDVSPENPSVFAPSYENVTIHEGDLIISGFENMLIENCLFVQTGNIEVRDNASLQVRHAQILFNDSYMGQYLFSVIGWATLITLNSAVTSNIHTWISVRDHANASMTNSTLDHGGIVGHNQAILTSTESTLSELVTRDQSQGIITNSFIGLMNLDFNAGTHGQIRHLESVTYNYWNLQKNATGTFNPINNVTLINTQIGRWSVGVDSDTNLTIMDSTLGRFIVSAYNSEILLNAVENGYIAFRKFGNVTISNSVIEEHLFHLHNSNALITDSILNFNFYENSNATISNSTLQWLHFWHHHGSLDFNSSIIDGRITLYYSSVFVSGNFTFGEVEVLAWVSSNITRNYETIVRDLNNNPINDAELTLLDVNDQALWTGSTDETGKTYLSMTFIETNYTDTFKLKVVKGNLSTIENVDLFSNTPLLLEILPPEYGGCLRIASTWPIPADLNPYVHWHAFSRHGALPLWSALFRRDENGTLRPDLAINYTTTNGLDFVVNLVENATWHDGVPFTSDDAIFTLEMLDNFTDPNLDSWWRWDWPEMIDSLEKLGDYSFVIHLNETYLGLWFPDSTDPSFANAYLDRLPIIAKHIYSNGLQPNGPIVGTGPWKLSSWTPFGILTLRVNTAYFKGRPYLDEIVYRWDIPLNQFAENILNNNVDVAHVAWGHFDSDQVSLISSAPGVSHSSMIGNTIEFMWMNLNRQPFSNLTIRQAITMAIDKQRICDASRGGYAVPAKSYVSPIWKDWYNPDVPQYSFNPEEAMRLLNNTNLNLTLIVPAYDPTRLNASLILAENLRDMGINLTVIEAPNVEYISSAMRNGEFDLAICGFSFNNDIDNVAHFLWCSYWWWNAMAPQIGFSNATIDAMLEEARVSVNMTEKQMIHNWIQGNITYLAPAVFLYWYENAIIKNNDFHGWPLESGINLLDSIILERVVYDPTLSGQGKSPVKVCFIDSLGRKAGYYNGSVYADIPGSEYIEDQELVKIRSPSGNYTIEILGTANGTYSLEVVNVALDYKNMYLPMGTIRAGQVRKYSVIVHPDGSISTVDYAVDLDGDHDVDIFDVVLACGAYGSMPGDQNWNMIADVAPPIEKVDIFDIVTIAGHYGESW